MNTRSTLSLIFDSWGCSPTLLNFVTLAGTWSSVTLTHVHMQPRPPSCKKGLGTRLYYNMHGVFFMHMFSRVQSIQNHDKRD